MASLHMTSIGAKPRGQNGVAGQTQAPRSKGDAFLRVIQTLLPSLAKGVGRQQMVQSGCEEHTEAGPNGV